MSTRTSHRRGAGKKSRHGKYLPGEKTLVGKKSRPVRNPDKNHADAKNIITAFAACEECFRYSMTVNGLCWACDGGGEK